MIIREPFLIEQRLLHMGSPGNQQWSNLGYWTARSDYAQAAENLARQLGEAAQLNAADFVLDVAFGRGAQLFFWQEEFDVRRIIGVELTRSYLHTTQQKIAAATDMQIDLLYGSATDLPQLRPASFDKVICLDSAYHFPARLQFLHEAYRLLKPGGRLTLTDLAVNQPPPQTMWRMATYFGEHYSHIPAHNLVNLTTYRHQLETIGFTNIEITTLEDRVFAGFARFIFPHFKSYARRSPALGWLKLLLTGVICKVLTHRPWLHYLLVTATKPPTN